MIRLIDVSGRRCGASCVAGRRQARPGFIGVSGSEKPTNDTVVVSFPLFHDWEAQAILWPGTRWFKALRQLKNARLRLPEQLGAGYEPDNAIEVDL